MNADFEKNRHFEVFKSQKVNSNAIGASFYKDAQKILI
jgi:hypothetical protein